MGRYVGSWFSDFYKSSNGIWRTGRYPTSDTVLFSEFLDYLEPIALDTQVRGAWGACLPVRALRTKLQIPLVRLGYRVRAPK